MELAEICAPYRTDSENIQRQVKARDSIPYGEGLLWKIEDKNGHSAYLFGTMHSQDRLVTASLPPRVNLALLRSHTVILEVIPDGDTSQVFTDAMYYSGERNLESLLETPLYNELVRIIPEYGFNPDMVKNIKPWAAFTLIGRPRPVRGPTLDTVLYQSALRSNKVIGGLETMEELVEQLDNIPLADQLEILTDTICNHNQIIRNTRKLRDLYIARDLAGIVLFNDQPHHDEAVYRRFIERMVYDRNRKMLKRIEQYIEQDNVFVALGASHLPGEQGILNKLAERGYIVKAVY